MLQLILENMLIRFFVPIRFWPFLRSAGTAYRTVPRHTLSPEKNMLYMNLAYTVAVLTIDLWLVRTDYNIKHNSKFTNSAWKMLKTGSYTAVTWFHVSYVSSVYRPLQALQALYRLRKQEMRTWSMIWRIKEDHLIKELCIYLYFNYTIQQWELNSLGPIVYCRFYPYAVKYLF